MGVIYLGSKPKENALNKSQVSQVKQNPKDVTTSGLKLEPPQKKSSSIVSKAINTLFPAVSVGKIATNALKAKFSPSETNTQKLKESQKSFFTTTAATAAAGAALALPVVRSAAAKVAKSVFVGETIGGTALKSASAITTGGALLAIGKSKTTRAKAIKSEIKDVYTGKIGANLGGIITGDKPIPTSLVGALAAAGIGGAAIYGATKAYDAITGGDKTQNALTDGNPIQNPGVATTPNNINNPPGAYRSTGRRGVKRKKTQNIMQSVRVNVINNSQNRSTKRYLNVVPLAR